MNKDDIMRMANIIITIGGSILTIIGCITQQKRENEAIEKAVVKYLEKSE